MKPERPPIFIEGYRPEELLELSMEQLQAIALSGETLVFRIGSAQVLGTFNLNEQTLKIELAQIEGGGEGVLPTLSVLAHKLARIHDFSRIEWAVHAVNCAKPNLKLRRVLERRGFVIRNLEGIGEAFSLVEIISGTAAAPENQ